MFWEGKTPMVHIWQMGKEEKKDEQGIRDRNIQWRGIRNPANFQPK